MEKQKNRSLRSVINEVYSHQAISALALRCSVGDFGKRLGFVVPMPFAGGMSLVGTFHDDGTLTCYQERGLVCQTRLPRNVVVSRRDLQTKTLRCCLTT